MNKQFKKIFSVLLAVLVGASIVFLAWGGGSFVNTNGAQTSNGGDWKDSLKVVPQAYSSKTLGASRANIDMTTSGATTTTDIVARRLLLEYTSSQKGSATSTMSDADVQKIANSLAQEVKLPHKKEYRLSDLNISSDNSHSANVLYIDVVNSMFSKLASTDRKDEELNILVTAMDTKDSSVLEKLSEKSILYQKFIQNLLLLKTPSDIAQIHLHLIQASESLRIGTLGLQNLLEDPAIGIVALAEYRNGFDGIVIVRKEYRDFFANF